MARGWVLGVVNGLGVAAALAIVPHCPRRASWMPLVGLGVGLAIGLLEDRAVRGALAAFGCRILDWLARGRSDVARGAASVSPAMRVHRPVAVRSGIVVRFRPERASLVWQALAGLVIVTMVVLGAAASLSGMHAAGFDRAVATTSDLVHAVDVDVLAAQAYDPTVHAAAASGSAAWSVTAPVGSPVTMTVSPNTTGVAVKASGSANVSIVGTLPTPLPTPN